jgi:predicted nucleic acid-binding protein
LWLEVVSPKTTVVAQLDLGESQAIALASELETGVLIDELAGPGDTEARGDP